MFNLRETERRLSQESERSRSCPEQPKEVVGDIYGLNDIRLPEIPQTIGAHGKQFSAPAPIQPKQSLFRRLTNWWFNSPTLGIESKIYNALGTQLFRRLLFATIGRSMYAFSGGTYRLRDASPEALKKLEGWTRFNETVHLAANMPALILALNGIPPLNWALPALALNAYCVMLQRVNRHKINNLLRKKEAWIQQKNLRRS